MCVSVRWDQDFLSVQPPCIQDSTLYPQNLFIHPKAGSFCLLANISSLPPRHQSLVTTSQPYVLISSVFLVSTYEWDHTVLVFLSLTYFSLSTTPLNFIHIVTNGKTFFFLMAEQRCAVSAGHVFSCESADRRSGCSHVSAVVSDAAVNTGVRTSLQCPVFISYIQKLNCWIIW